jgi:hypothetical protein
MNRESTSEAQMDSALIPYNLRGRNFKLLLKEPYNFDLRPADGSQAIAVGVILPGVSDGFKGTALDLCVYKYRSIYPHTLGLFFEYLVITVMSLSDYTFVFRVRLYDFYPKRVR